MSDVPYARRLRDLPIQEALKIELRRLNEGLIAGEPVVGLFVDPFVVSCRGNAETVLDRAKAMLRLVDEKGLEGAWPSREAWLSIVPSWFRDRCAPEQTPEEYAREVEQRSLLTYEERFELEADEAWSVRNWISWMEPSEREWIWRIAWVKDPDTLIVEIDEIEDPPMVARGDFWWLMVACGALDVDIAGRDDYD